jgi:hypothetical protein
VLTLLFPGASSHIYPFAHAFRVKHSDELYSFSVPTTSAAPIHSYRNLRGLSSHLWPEGPSQHSGLASKRLNYMQQACPHRCDLQYAFYQFV